MKAKELGIDLATIPEPPPGRAAAAAVVAVAVAVRAGARRRAAAAAAAVAPSRRIRAIRRAWPRSRAGPNGRFPRAFDFVQAQRRRYILITQMAELLKDFDMYVPGGGVGRVSGTSACTRRRAIRARSCRTSSSRRRRGRSTGGAPDTTRVRRIALQSAADLRGARGESLQRRSDPVGGATSFSWQRTGTRGIRSSNTGTHWQFNQGGHRGHGELPNVSVVLSMFSVTSVVKNTAGGSTREHAMNKREFVRTLGGASLGLMFSPSVLSRYMAMPHDRARRRTRPSGPRSAASTGSRPSTSTSRTATTACRPSPCSRRSSGTCEASTSQASRYMRTRQPDDKLRVRTRLATMAGVARGAHHHAQHHRVARHGDQRLRLEAGRRSRDGRAGLRRHARHVQAPGAPPRHRESRRFAAARPAVGRRDRAALRERHHAEDAAPDGRPHGEHHRPHPAGARRSPTWRTPVASTSWCDGAHAFAPARRSASPTSAATTTARRSTNG